MQISMGDARNCQTAHIVLCSNCDCVPGVAQGISDGGLTVPTRGLQYGIQAPINAKSSQKIAFHFPTGD